MLYPEEFRKLASQEDPHWEHGYRCHGYWLGLVRIGAVGIGPFSGDAKRDGYGWTFRNPNTSADTDGREATLRKAKRQVEKLWRDFKESSGIARNEVMVQKRETK